MSKNDHHHKEHKKQTVATMWKKGTLVYSGGMQTDAATMENSVQISQNTKKRTTV